MFVCSLPWIYDELLLVLRNERYLTAAILPKFMKTLLASPLRVLTASVHIAQPSLFQALLHRTHITDEFISINKGFVVTVVFTLRTM